MKSVILLEGAKMDIFDGVELSDEQRAAVQKNLDAGITEGFVARSEFDAVNGKKEELLGEKKAEQVKRVAAEELAEAQRLEKAEASGDVASLKTSYEERLAAKDVEIAGFQTEKKTTQLQKVAQGFVNDHVKDDKFVRESMTNKLMNRLDVRDGKTVVLGADGNLSSHSVDDLFNEFKTAAEYKPHLVATKASGGGADGGNGGSGGGSASDLANKSFTDCKTDAERAEVVKAKREARTG